MWFTRVLFRSWTTRFQRAVAVWCGRAIPVDVPPMGHQAPQQFFLERRPRGPSSGTVHWWCVPRFQAVEIEALLGTYYPRLNRDLFDGRLPVAQFSVGPAPDWDTSPRIDRTSAEHYHYADWARYERLEYTLASLVREMVDVDLALAGGAAAADALEQARTIEHALGFVFKESGSNRKTVCVGLGEGRLLSLLRSYGLEVQPWTGGWPEDTCPIHDAVERAFWASLDQEGR